MTHEVGSTVFVVWYGKVLQGEVVNNHDLFDMVAVRIPLMGGQPVALFMPTHIYPTADAVPAGSPASAGGPTVSVIPLPASAPSKDKPVSPAWQRLQDFKTAHWDAAHNRLQIDALDTFYDIWRASVAAKRQQSPQPKAATVPEGSPSGITSVPSPRFSPLPKRKHNQPIQLTFNF